MMSGFLRIVSGSNLKQRLKRRIKDILFKPLLSKELFRQQLLCLIIVLISQLNLCFQPLYKKFFNEKIKLQYNILNDQITIICETMKQKVYNDLKKDSQSKTIVYINRGKFEKANVFLQTIIQMNFINVIQDSLNSFFLIEFNKPISQKIGRNTRFKASKAQAKLKAQTKLKQSSSKAQSQSKAQAKHKAQTKLKQSLFRFFIIYYTLQNQRFIAFQYLNKLFFKALKDIHKIIEDKKQVKGINKFIEKEEICISKLINQQLTSNALKLENTQHKFVIGQCRSQRFFFVNEFEGDNISLQEKIQFISFHIFNQCFINILLMFHYF
eukprot:TRINITY_DN4672_c0_g1_i1.p1 TRINITY_DN4672_c0_g1~~TRINITY_DN4672_c0_g1_i1.p1  ORF type:complete len:325 (-),score=-14.05 TRINITY_DN4672_c0_g1_i1:165-1139(-)